jgi:hypothetical protein
MPQWICDSCGTRLYSASESLKWGDCPVCTGKLAAERDEPPRLERDHGQVPHAGHPHRAR